MNSFLAALALLTIFPIRRALNFSSGAFAYFPYVGALLGLVLVSTRYAADLLFPSSVSAALIVALWALLTGALHLDGVSDACDALLAATTRERRLEILRDAHVGAFGVTGVALVLLMKFAALVEINPLALLLAPVLARWAMVYAATFPLARSEGMGALFAKGLTRRQIFFATFAALIFAAPFGWLGAGAWISAVVVATLLARLAMARLGGLSGDVYGLICEIVEVSVLVVSAIAFGGT